MRSRIIALVVGLLAVALPRPSDALIPPAEVREPGSDRFVTLFKDTTDNTLDFLPRRRGIYRVRGRTQNLDGTSTGWSGSLKLTVT